MDGPRVRALREERGMPQREFAEVAGVSRGTRKTKVSKGEAGTRKLNSPGKVRERSHRHRTDNKASKLNSSRTMQEAGRSFSVSLAPPASGSRVMWVDRKSTRLNSSHAN